VHPALIQIENVTKVYTTGDVEFPALAGVSLTVDKGDFVAIMGASGSGKSTLMHILGCLDRPTGGSYCMEGNRVSAMAQNELAEARNLKIGFVFQSFNLVPRTSAFENVELPLLYADAMIPSRERRDRVMNALARVNMQSKAKQLPSQLSGGEQQRVAIARSLINNPSLLLADEPTGALDSHTSLAIMELFVKLNDEGNTIVLVTHEADISSFTKRQVVLRDGRIIRDEPIEQRASARDSLAALGRGLEEQS